jgi:hypothetical protein
MAVLLYNFVPKLFTLFFNMFVLQNCVWESDLWRLMIMFSIARSAFRMYSVIAIFKSSIVWGLFKYTEFFNAQRIFDHPVLLLLLLQMLMTILHFTGCFLHRDVLLSRLSKRCARKVCGPMWWGVCNITTFKRKGHSFVRVRPSDRDALSVLYSLYHQIYGSFHLIMPIEFLVRELY